MKLVLPTRPATALPPRARYSCAFCGKEAVKRKSTGIWTCGGCKRTQTGAFGRTPRALPARAAASYRTPRVAIMRPKRRAMRLGRGFCARTGIRAPWPRFHPRPTRAPPLPHPHRRRRVCAGDARRGGHPQQHRTFAEGWRGGDRMMRGCGRQGAACVEEGEEEGSEKCPRSRAACRALAAGNAKPASKKFKEGRSAAQRARPSAQ